MSEMVVSKAPVISSGIWAENLTAPTRRISTSDFGSAIPVITTLAPLTSIPVSSGGDGGVLSMTSTWTVAIASLLDPSLTRSDTTVDFSALKTNFLFLLVEAVKFTPSLLSISQAYSSTLPLLSIDRPPSKITLSPWLTLTLVLSILACGGVRSNKWISKLPSWG